MEEKKGVIPLEKRPGPSFYRLKGLLGHGWTSPRKHRKIKGEGWKSPILNLFSAAL